METGAVIAPRPFLTVKEVMILMGCKQDKAYKTMRKINLESEREGYMRFDAGKVNKHVFAKKLQIPEEDIEKAIQYVAAQKQEGKMAFYKICPDCGCSLDPGEKCDCRMERERKEDVLSEYIKIEARGQYSFNFKRLECGYREKATI